MGNKCLIGDCLSVLPTLEAGSVQWSERGIGVPRARGDEPHYYCLPESVWTPDLLDGLPSASGILLINERKHGDFYLRCERIENAQRQGRLIA